MNRVETRPPTSPSGWPSPRPGTPGRAVRVLLIGAAALLALAPAVAPAEPGGALKGVKFDQNLDAQVPLNLRFRDGNGREVVLAEYFGKRPVILVMGYKKCPMLCSQVLSELTRSLKPLEASVGKDFDIVNVSINPRELPAEADSQRRIYLRQYNRPGAEAGWHALVGDQKAIDALADAVGFKYQYSEKLNLYAHAAGFAILTPTGRISRYFYGVEYPARELKPALANAAVSKIAAPISKVLLFCYDYDPTTGRYTFAIMSVIRVLGLVTVLTFGVFLVAMVRRDRRMGRATGPTFSELPSGPAIP